jgi:competence protein ComGC
MVLWFIVGLIVWILCVLFMLAIIKGGHRIRGNGYEQKLYFRGMVNTQNIENSIEKEVKNTTRTRRNRGLIISEIV